MTTPTRKTVDGPIHKTPCAHCGRPNDLTGIAEDLADGFEPGTQWGCDHCKGLNVVTLVKRVTVVQSRQS